MCIVKSQLSEFCDLYANEQHTPGLGSARSPTQGQTPDAKTAS